MAADGKVLVQARLPLDVVKAVDHLSVDWQVYRVQAIERLLRAALKAEREFPSTV